MNLECKKAGKADIPVIYELAKKIWNDYYLSIITQEQIDYMLDVFYSGKSLAKQMDEGQAFTIAYHEKKPIGYISISTKDKKNYFLHKFYVEITEQRKGIGTEFFKYMTSQLKGAESIELTVNRKNIKAINFYFKNGFKIKEVADFDIGHGFFMNDFVMIRHCDPAFFSGRSNLVGKR